LGQEIKRNSLIRLNKALKERLGGMSHSTAYREISKGNLKVVHVGRSVFVTEHEIDRYINHASGAEC
jgi:predicted DNA-binding transcriptional regulator AlpA